MTKLDVIAMLVSALALAALIVLCALGVLR